MGQIFLVLNVRNEQENQDQGLAQLSLVFEVLFHEEVLRLSHVQGLDQEVLPNESEEELPYFQLVLLPDGAKEVLHLSVLLIDLSQIMLEVVGDETVHVLNSVDFVENLHPLPQNVVLVVDEFHEHVIVLAELPLKTDVEELPLNVVGVHVLIQVLIIAVCLLVQFGDEPALFLHQGLDFLNHLIEVLEVFDFLKGEILDVGERTHLVCVAFHEHDFFCFRQEVEDVPDAFLCED